MKGERERAGASSSISIDWVDSKDDNYVSTDDIFASDFVHARWRIAGVPFDMSRADSEQGTVVTLKGGSSDY